MNLESNPYGPYIQDGGPTTIPEDEVAIFVPKYNTGNKKDSTGAFIPEAKAFCDYWNISRDRINYIDNKLPKSVHRAGNVADALLDKMEEVQAQAEKPIAVWVFFCHGYTHGLQFSIRSSGHRHFDTEYAKRYSRFVNIMADHPSPAVILYACSTGDDPEGAADTAPGSGDGSFGDLLRDDLCAKGAIYCRIFVHTTAGHTTINPRFKLLDGNGSITGETGGVLLALPGSKEFKNLQISLRTNFRFKVPFMTRSSIQNEIK